MAKKIFLIATVLTLLTTMGGCAGDTSGANGGLDKLVVRLNYTPWAMHNYLYAALDRGYFKDHGLDVTIKPSESGQAIQFVGTGKEDVGLTDASTMLSAAEKGAPLVAVAMDHPESPGAYFYLKKSGIKKAADLEGKNICAPNGSNVHDALLAGLKRQQVDVDSVKFTSIAAGSEVSLVASGKCDASEGFSYGQPLTLAGKGMPAGSITVSDLGVELYGVVLFTSQATLAKKKDELTRFVEAVGEGQLWTYKHLRKATANTLKRTDGRTVENEMQKANLIYDGYRNNSEFSQRWGRMTAASWRKTVSELKAMGTLKEDVTVDEIFTNELVDNTKSTWKFAKMCTSSKPEK